MVVLTGDKSSSIKYMYNHFAGRLSRQLQPYKIASLTCTVDSISIKTSIAGTLKATKGVIAGGIFMTVVHPSCTLINIYK